MNIMNINERKEYCKILSEMSRSKLIDECIKTRKRLDRLSGICNVEDTYKIMQENIEMNRKLMHAEKAMGIILKNLDSFGVKYNNREHIEDLLHLLIDTLNKPH